MSGECNKCCEHCLDCTCSTLKNDITGKEMCELISEYLASKGIIKTWEEIWNYSPTGELFKIFEWYEEAKSWKRDQMEYIILRSLKDDSNPTEE